MKNKVIILFILILVTFIGCTRGNKFTNNTDKKFHNGLTDVNCSHLTDKQKEFASKLSDTHRQVYCKVFSNDQRKKALSIYDTAKKTKMKSKTDIIPVNPDQAVENIIKANREIQE